MASANVTCPGNSQLEIPADGTQRTATLNRFGGRLINYSAVDVVVNVEGGTINSVAVGSLDPGSVIVRAAAGGAPPVPVPLPMTCQKFTFKSTAGQAAITYDPSGGA